jgi:SAM-dependent methyltransferase
MNWTTDRKVLSEKQYQDDRNLEKRIAIHQYSVSEQKWPDFIKENIRFKETDEILDIGCGNGRLWNVLLNRNSKIKRLVLSDISYGMIDKAKASIKQLGVHNNVEFEIADVTKMPFKEGSFDVVIANHMLYHASNIESALSEISRILKSNGKLFATTIGVSHMKEIKGILEVFKPNFKFESEELARRFGLDNGPDLLTQFLGTGERIRYIDHLLIPEPNPIVDWICSMDNDGILDESDLKKHLEENYDFTKGFRITKETGIVKGIKKTKK